MDVMKKQVINKEVRSKEIKLWIIVIILYIYNRYLLYSTLRVSGNYKKNLWNKVELNYNLIIKGSIILVIIILLFLIYVVNNDGSYICYAESYNDYRRGNPKLTAWDLRYNSKYNDKAYFNIVLDVTCCCFAYGLFILSIIWK